MNKFTNRFTISFIFSIISFIGVGQQIIAPPKPTVCTTPPAGYKIGGKVSFSPNVVCIAAGATTGTVLVENINDPNANVKVDDPRIFIGVDNTFDINTATFTNLIGDKTNAIAKTGSSWVMIEGKKGTQKYLQCLILDIIPTANPKIVATECTGNKVDINIPQDVANIYDKYVISWGTSTETIDMNGKNLPLTVSRTFTGTPPLIEIQGFTIRSGQDVCKSSRTTIPINDTFKPFLIYLEGENEGKEATIKFLNFAAGTSYDVLVQLDNGSASNVWNKLTTANNGNAKLTGLDANSRYCFKLGSKNACGVDVFSQNTLCSIKLGSTLKSTNEADIKWNLPAEPNAIPSRLELTQEIPGDITSKNKPFLPSTTTTSKNITGLDCAKDYQFQVTVSYPPVLFSGASPPWSVTVKSALHILSPKKNAVALKPLNLVAVDYDPVDNQKIKVLINDLTNPAATGKVSYTFYRSVDGGPSQLLGTNASNSWDDVAVNSDPKSYCYTYQKQDECGITSLMSDPFCTILLTSKALGTLNWTPFLTPPDIVTSQTPVEYSVQYFDPVFQAFTPFVKVKDLSKAVKEILEKSTEPEVIFKIYATKTVATATDPNQFIFSNSNTLALPVPVGVYIPTAFTPSGDGINEVFEVKTKFIQSGSIKIYDRWGGSVYEGDLMAVNWEGNKPNSTDMLPSGTYPYIIKATTTTGKDISMKGTISILR